LSVLRLPGLFVVKRIQDPRFEDFEESEKTEDPEDSELGFKSQNHSPIFREILLQ